MLNFLKTLFPFLYLIGLKKLAVNFLQYHVLKTSQTIFTLSALTLKLETTPIQFLKNYETFNTKKPHNGPKFSDTLIRFSLMQYYTSPQAYKMLLKELPLPSVSLLRKLSQGGLDSMKACKTLYEQGHISKDVNLLIDEMYLQKEVQYDGDRVVGK